LGKEGGGALGSARVRGRAVYEGEACSRGGFGVCHGGGEVAVTRRQGGRLAGPGVVLLAGGPGPRRGRPARASRATEPGPGSFEAASHLLLLLRLPLAGPLLAGHALLDQPRVALPAVSCT
jgi:hypothetical protein